MGDGSGIEWTDATWNPTRGCSRVSPGCDNCYAMRQAHRQSGPGGAYEGLTRIGARGVDWSGRVRLVPEQLELPLRWRKPRRIFVDSMSDLFHPALSDEEIAAVFGVMAACPRHTFQVLTKRPERASVWFSGLSTWGCRGQTSIGDMVQEFARGAGAPVPSHYGVTPWPLPNVHLGASVENQATFDARAAELAECPAAVRFLSIEPLLGPINVSRALRNDSSIFRGLLNWAIIGGESGNGARPCALQWVRDLVRQFDHAGVPVFVKQLGARPTIPASELRTLHDAGELVLISPQGRTADVEGRGLVQLALKSRKGGDWSEWPEDLRRRQFPEVRP